MPNSLKHLGLFFLFLVSIVFFNVMLLRVLGAICPTYLIRGFPPVAGLADLNLLAAIWGIPSAILYGGAVSLALLFCQSEKVTPLVQVLVFLCLLPTVISIVAFNAGKFFAQLGWVFLIGNFANRVPRDEHSVFIACLWANWAFIIGIGISALTLFFIKKKRRDTPKLMAS